MPCTPCTSSAYLSPQCHQQSKRCERLLDNAEHGPFLSRESKELLQAIFAQITNIENRLPTLEQEEDAQSTRHFLSSEMIVIEQHLFDLEKEFFLRVQVTGIIAHYMMAYMMGQTQHHLK